VTVAKPRDHLRQDGPRHGRGSGGGNRARWLLLLGAAAVAVPGSLLGLSRSLRLGAGGPPLLLVPWQAALLFGLAVVGAAFILAWAAEAAQVDVSASLAIAALALIAVLPEYAVSFVFAWKSGVDVRHFGPGCLPPPGHGQADAPSNCSLVLANMTGSNRLLIGVGWALVVLLAWWRSRVSGERRGGITLARGQSVELTYLALACAYSLTLPLKRTVTLLDAAVLVGLFVAYSVRMARAPAGEPELFGPSAAIGGLRRWPRRALIVLLFLFAAGVILLVAEHFADALVATGSELGVNHFLLVQWLAPLASEAPELLVAGFFAWRLQTGAALTTLVSSKVNQWTLLVGTLPLVFAVASHGAHGLPIDLAERKELLLTAAQTVFALGILANLALSVAEAIALFSLFAAQFVLHALLPPPARGVEILLLSGVYLLLGLALVLRHRHELPRRLRDGLVTPYRELGEPEPGTHGGR
jgi:cation:H+ antiporter